MTNLLRHKLVITYSAALAIILLFLKWIEMRYALFHPQHEIYGTLIAVTFAAFGAWLALTLRKPKLETIIVEKEIFVTPPVSFTINEAALRKSGLSRRELEVLQLMAEGLSNQEIASRLFVSLNTIKTHNSQIFVKMDVKRRTQAVSLGKKLGLIP